MNAKVCILTTVHPPFDTRVFHKEAKSLAQGGYEVVLIAQHEKNEVIDGIKIVALPKPKNRIERMLMLTWRAFRLALRERADVYHFHDPELLPWGALLKMRTRRKVIYDVHENVKKQILNKEWLPLWSRKIFSMFYGVLEKAMLPFVDKIILAEDSYIHNYQGYQKVAFVRNYPLLSYAKADAEDALSQEDKADVFTVTYVGGVVKIRGVFESVEAVRILHEQGYQQIRLNLIGRVMPPGLKEELEELIRKYGLEAQVSIPGPVPHNEVYNVLSQSDVGIVVLHPDPNYLESLPTKLFEYMAVGIPVIASNFPLWQSIVEGEACGLTVNPLDPKAIADAIRWLLEHPEEAKEMGRRGRQAVLEKYSWEKEAERLLHLYLELL